MREKAKTRRRSGFVKRSGGGEVPGRGEKGSGVEPKECSCGGARSQGNWEMDRKTFARAGEWYTGRSSKVVNRFTSISP
jgi:hypothetical protein